MRTATDTLSWIPYHIERVNECTRKDRSLEDKRYLISRELRGRAIITRANTDSGGGRKEPKKNRCNCRRCVVKDTVLS